MNPIKRPFLHSVPQFALCGRDLLLHVILPGEMTSVSAPEMVWRVDESPAVSTVMRAVEEFSCEGEKYCLFSTLIPGGEFKKEGTLSYAFLTKGTQCSSYRIPICTEGKMPPFAISEWFVRPKNKSGIMYAEIFNPTTEDVDLYDYKFMSFGGTEFDAETPRKELMLADKKGTAILHAGELAVLRLIPLALHDAVNAECLSDAYFCAQLIEFRHEDGVVFTPDSMRIIPVEQGYYDETAGKYLPKPHTFDMPVDYSAITLMIVPRDGSFGDAVYTMVYNDVPYHMDTPVRRSSLWKIDVRNPGVAVRMAHAAPPTPGILDKNQTIPDPSIAAVPQIIPLIDPDTTYLTDGDLKIRFGICAALACEAKVMVRVADGQFEAFVAEYDAAAAMWQAVIPHKFLQSNLTIRYYIIASGNFRTAMLGDPDNLMTIHVLDNEGPAIVKNIPSEGYGSLDPLQKFYVEFADISGINTDESILCVDKKDVTHLAKWKETCVSYCPEKPLKIGAHTYELLLRDHLGNKAYYKFSFTVSDIRQMNCYRGQVHSHTGDSDGSLSPADAIRYARDVGHADYFAVTDHSHHMGVESYLKQIEVANQYNVPGAFAVLYGWEMTYNMNFGYWGHLNVLNTDWIEQGYLSTTLAQVYEKIKKDPDAVAMFNHPGLAWGNFDDFSDYDKEIDEKIMLSEIRGMGYDREYTNLLHKGFHASPVYNEDNHGINWTTATNSTGVVLAPALTRDNILEAFRARRTYSTSDKTMSLYFQINGAWLGSHIKRSEQLCVEVDVSTESETGIGTIQLVTEDGIVVTSVDVGALRKFNWKVTVPSLYDYYYIRMIAKGQYTVTAPVWIDDKDNDRLNISCFSLGVCEDEYRPHVLKTKLTNKTTKTMRNVEVSFYLTGIGGPNLSTAQPYKTVYLSSILPGKEQSVSANFPNLEGMRRVTVIAKASIGDREYADTDFAILSPLYISEIMPATSCVQTPDGTKYPDAYRYLTLYNTTNRTIDMENYSIRLWNKTGKAPAENCIQPLFGMKIAPHSCLVLWQCSPDAPLTAQDFNAHFGTALTEGENLFRVEKNLLEHTTAARRLDICCGNELLTRVQYNMGEHEPKGYNVDQAIRYIYRPSITGSSEWLEYAAVPQPGTLDSKQSPATLSVTPEGKGKSTALKRAAKTQCRCTKKKILRGAALVATTAVIVGLLSKKR